MRRPNLNLPPEQVLAVLQQLIAADPGLIRMIGFDPSDKLGAVIGDSTLHQGLRRYFLACGFKHPAPVDVQRAMEAQTGLQLGWYFREWVNTTRTLDYAVADVVQHGDTAVITLERKGEMLMPVDVAVTARNGTVQWFNVPLSLMLGARKENPQGKPFGTLPPWQWTNPAYTFKVAVPGNAVGRVQLDPFNRLGDTDRDNNTFTVPSSAKGTP